MSNVKTYFNKVRDVKALKVLALVSLPFFPLFCLFLMEYMNFGGDLHRVETFLERHPMSAVFGAIAIIVIFAVTLLFARKAFIAAGIVGFFSIAFAYINYMKVATNGDNFFPRDIALARNPYSLITFASGNVPGYFWLGVAVVVLWVFALWLFRARLPLGWKIRIPAAVGTICVIVFLFFTPPRSEAVLNRFNMSRFDAALQSSNYRANGFLGAFIINVLSMRIERPPEYSRATIDALLRDFTHTPATAEYFDVIVVLSESFFDVRMLDAQFSQNPLPNFDEIIQRPNAYSGLIYTTALNGGTVRPEFDILTGLTTDHLPGGSIPYGFIRHDMTTHVSHYRDFGYRTIALHPYNERFYQRNTAYPLMGFNEFLGEEELLTRFGLEYIRGFATDMSLLAPMKYFLDGSDEPMFMFVITMQNHQPFPPMDPADIRIEVSSDALNPEVLSAVTTFTHGLHDADRMLGALVDYIDNRERPTVMLFFGDHLPNLGGSLAAFIQSGLLESDALHTQQARMVMYSTPFVIYANRTLHPGIFPQNTDNHVSTYYLMSAIAFMTGFHRTPYMNLLLDYHARVPFHNIRLQMEETDDIRSLSRAMKLITYDRLVGSGFSND